MLLKKILIVVLISISIISCNSGADRVKKDKDTGFVAQIDSTMTLTQVAKANNIGEPYLRTELGVRHNIGKNYTIAQMAKRFKFSIDDLRKIIEDRKNKQAETIKRKKERAAEKEMTH